MNKSETYSVLSELTNHAENLCNDIGHTLGGWKEVDEETRCNQCVDCGADITVIRDRVRGKTHIEGNAITTRCNNRRVIIEVHSGVATVVSQPGDIEVVIHDLDVEEVGV